MSKLITVLNKQPESVQAIANDLMKSCLPHKDITSLFIAAVSALNQKNLEVIKLRNNLRSLRKGERLSDVCAAMYCTDEVENHSHFCEKHWYLLPAATRLDIRKALAQRQNTPLGTLDSAVGQAILLIREQEREAVNGN